MEKFKFELPTIGRKKDALDYLYDHKINNSKINGTGGLNRCYDEKFSYEEWLEDVINSMNKEYAEKENLVSATTFFTIRESDNKIVGMVNFRHYLNEELEKSGGHIGYGIRPSERGKGYAKIQLYLALLFANKLGLNRVMIDCVDTNIASDKTIQALDGKLDHIYFEKEKNRNLKVYWINVNESLKKYKNIYEPMLSDIMKNNNYKI